MQAQEEDCNGAAEHDLGWDGGTCRRAASRVRRPELNLPFPFGRGAVMRWSKCLARAATVWALVCDAPTSGAAELQPVRTRLDWGTSLCGNAAGFSARVLKRTRRVRFVRADPQLTVALSIAASGSGLNASVSLQAPGRAAVTRHIESPDCDDALDALALVVAISVEARSQEADFRSKERRRRPSPRKRPRPPAVTEPVPAAAEARVEPVPEPPTAPVPPPSTRLVDVVVPPEPASVAPPPASVPRAPAADAAAPIQKAPPAQLVPTLQVAARPEEQEELDLVGGVSAQVLFGAAPDALIGGQLWLRARWDRDGLWSPALALSYSHQRLDEHVRDQGRADFALNVAALELCPLRLGGPALQVGPCLLGSLGRLRSTGHETYDPGGETRPWGSVGASAQALARWSVLELRVSFGVLHPLVRDAFRFGPACSGAACEGGVFHRVGAVLWSADAGVGVDFW